MTAIVSPAPRVPKAARARSTFSWPRPWVITEPPSQRPFDAIAAVVGAADRGDLRRDRGGQRVDAGDGGERFEVGGATVSASAW